MAVQIIADLYGCREILDDMAAITLAAHKAIDYVGAQIVEECTHKFDPIGITYFAVISTSHFSIHTWPEYGYAAIDIFSCNDMVADGISQMLKQLFDEGVYEIGWIYNRNFWRQGYAYESCKAVIDYAFAERKAHKIFAEAIDAVKSVGLMKKLGMQLEGIQRSQVKDNHGNWADLYFYGLLEDNWRNNDSYYQNL